MKKFLSTVLSLAIVLSMAGCAGAATPAANKEAGEKNDAGLPVLRIATMPFITSLPTYYIQQHKLDEKAGFKMETTMFATGAPMNEALAADLWDVGAMGAAAVTGVANYDEMIIGEVLESTDGLGVFVKPDSPIAKEKGFNPSYPTVLGSPETVKGITILTPIGTAQHFTTLKWLEKLGLASTDVNLVNMDTVQAYQAMQAGQCDAVALNVPTFFNAKNDGMVQVGNLSELGTKYVDMLVANRKAVEGKADLVQLYVNCIMEACDALQKDPEMAADLFVQYLQESGTETSRENCMDDLKRVKFIGKADWDGRDLGAFARELGEFYVGLGQLEPSVMDKFGTNIVDTFVK